MCIIDIENDYFFDFKKIFIDLKNKNQINEIRVKSDKNVIYESMNHFSIRDYKFKLFFEVEKFSLVEVILHWVDGPIYQCSWENVNLTKLNQEFNLLKKLFENILKSVPVEGNREYRWKTQWGILSIIKNPRDFNVVTYIKI